MPKTTTNGIEIYYEEQGDPAAPAMLLIMGFGAQLTLWPDELVEALAAQGFRVIRYDNRDVGLSQKFDGVKAPGLVKMTLLSKIGFTPKVRYTLADVADEWAKEFQAKASREAGVFHHLITLPTYHTAALSTDQLVEGYFGDQGMLAYAKGVQREEIRRGIATVKHQDMAGSNIGDDHKEYFSGEAALKAGGKDNTMNQF